MDKVLFVINHGIYPHITGGMEVFNYHLINNLSHNMPVAYMATHKYDYDSAEYIASRSIRPNTIFAPLQLLIFLLFHRKYKNVVFSFSAASWLIWPLYAIVIKLLNLKSTIVIHYGKEVPQHHTSAYKFFLKSASNIIAVSDDIKRNYDYAFDLDCKVLYPLIPFKKSEFSQAHNRKIYQIPNDANVLSMVGSLKEMKNPQTLLEALRLFNSSELTQYNPYIVYVGDGPMRTTLEDYVNRNNLSERVRFLGVIPNDKVCDIFSLSDIYIIASDFEGTSISLLEAMFNAKPIIASNVPGLNDMIFSGENGLLFEHNSSAELKKKIVQLLSDRGYSDSLGKTAYNSFLNKYSYSNIIGEYERILNK